MPNRILKESICRSDTIDQLTWFEEVLFYRLIVSCDDYGRFDGRPAIIRGTCFPLKDITNKTIADALQKLTSVGLVREYYIQGRPYLHMATWGDHQQVRAKKSKYPAEESNCENLISNDIKCNQVISSDCNSPRNPIQSEYESKTISRAEPERFEDFVAAYPKAGADLPGVAVEYLNTLRMGVNADELVQAARNYAEACQIRGTQPQYVLNAENFLRKLKFDEYLPEKYKKPKTPKRQQTSVDQYNQFMKHDYDMDSLEAALLGK
ncbi:putative uncharacterized protein [Firmicutes bacterium CAG:24]|nr:putative uncharacterized protein [Firmicutes bacterium CAG:24]